MRDEDTLPVSTPTAIYSSSVLISSNKKETLDSSIFRRGRYKFWALSAIILLAFWSMFTGTVTLHFSVGNLNRLSDEFAGGSPIYDDFDVLEIEEREKVVKHMWDVYTNSRRIKLPRFWQEAFVAAYEELTRDAPEVREAAISEIAKMSFRSVDLHPPHLHSTNLRELSLRHAQQNETGLPLK
ncbi:hypothetical protein L1987_34175 [Smallanthus sonchifolius]|uniref:Uncharacterized protein n=1 Tax=Smallanthus sonchifolius TaxID=185202 RepID=A0ACB9HTT4_9ASTR|nr:hypothetical protein L1987_34175 [Smallanthus sonchifolius]